MLLLCSASFAQTNQITVQPSEQLTIKRGAAASAKVKLRLREGFHCNTNKPSDEYLIPLRLTFAPASGLESTGVTYPKGKDEKYSFSEKPMNVYSGEFELVANFKAAADAKKGIASITGKLRYQACNDSMCFSPKTVDVVVPVLITE